MALGDRSRTESGEGGQTVALAAGDALAFLAFAAIGLASHGRLVGGAALREVVEIAAPFAAGWFVVAPVVGAYRRESSMRQMLTRTVLAWLLAWPIGLILRAWLRQTGVPLTFALITFLTHLLLLLGWRGVFAWLIRRSPER